MIDVSAIDLKIHIKGMRKRVQNMMDKSNELRMKADAVADEISVLEVIFSDSLESIEKAK